MGDSGAVRRDFFKTWCEEPFLLYGAVLLCAGAGQAFFSYIRSYDIVKLLKYYRTEMYYEENQA